MRTMQVSSISLVILLALVFTSAAQAQEKRRWSPQAKGTAIGVGVGGAAGAIINKRNRAVGGVIGGLAGGAAGYGVGKTVDNRRKTNARIAAAEREAAEARREAAVARQEAASVANKPAVVVNRPAVAQRRVSPAAVSAVAGAGIGTALAATAFTAQTVSGPYAGNTLFLSNSSYGDQNSAYPTSEVRRKSW
jgi:hypothetical protein